ncbi:hypothetical protein HD553DRAFT_327244 [Filobasidium floriforme]|uniref:uncharacterized protein n=1 Tax=Filobasidium floriforme TaxID=5210 RepID=UPI001E8E2678|nr:uncharacterized protein HD553DRAFT_327244 [Filobasidium floriforme]KAH8077651.1 hypothetical protein HD553DRAFT_327244 [Filobasidium floriforme]
MPQHNDSHQQITISQADLAAAIQQAVQTALRQAGPPQLPSTPGQGSYSPMIPGTTHNTANNDNTGPFHNRFPPAPSITHSPHSYGQLPQHSTISALQTLRNMPGHTPPGISRNTIQNFNSINPSSASSSSQNIRPGSPFASYLTSGRKGKAPARQTQITPGPPVSICKEKETIVYYLKSSAVISDRLTLRKGAEAVKEWLAAEGFGKPLWISANAHASAIAATVQELFRREGINEQWCWAKTNPHSHRFEPATCRPSSSSFNQVKALFERSGCAYIVDGHVNDRDFTYTAPDYTHQEEVASRQFYTTIRNLQNTASGKDDEDEDVEDDDDMWTCIACGKSVKMISKRRHTGHCQRYKIYRTERNGRDGRESPTPSVFTEASTPRLVPTPRLVDAFPDAMPVPRAHQSGPSTSSSTGRTSGMADMSLETAGFVDRAEPLFFTDQATPAPSPLASTATLQTPSMEDLAGPLQEDLAAVRQNRWNDQADEGWSGFDLDGRQASLERERSIDADVLGLINLSQDEPPRGSQPRAHTPEDRQAVQSARDRPDDRPVGEVVGEVARTEHSRPDRLPSPIEESQRTVRDSPSPGPATPAQRSIQNASGRTIAQPQERSVTPEIQYAGETGRPIAANPARPQPLGGRRRAIEATLRDMQALLQGLDEGSRARALSAIQQGDPLLASRHIRNRFRSGNLDNPEGDVNDPVPPYAREVRIGEVLMQAGPPEGFGLAAEAGMTPPREIPHQVEPVSGPGVPPPQEERPAAYSDRSGPVPPLPPPVRPAVEPSVDQPPPPSLPARGRGYRRRRSPRPQEGRPRPEPATEPATLANRRAAAINNIRRGRSGPSERGRGNRAGEEGRSRMLSGVGCPLIVPCKVHRPAAQGNVLADHVLVLQCRSAWSRWVDDERLGEPWKKYCPCKPGIWARGSERKTMVGDIGVQARETVGVAVGVALSSLPQRPPPNYTDGFDPQCFLLVDVDVDRALLATFQVLGDCHHSVVGSIIHPPQERSLLW